MFQFMKRVKARAKYNKWKKNNPDPEINYIGDDPNVSFEMKIVCFVNDEFPLENITLGIADAVGRWFYKNSEGAQAKDWFRRAGNPIIYKVYNTDGMEELLEMHSHIANKEISTFAAEPIAICLGPMWTNELLMYNSNYEQLSF